MLGSRYRRNVAWLALWTLWLQVAFVLPHICPDDVAALGSSGGPGFFLASAPADDDAPLCPLSNGRGGNSCVVYGSAHQGGTTLLPDAAKVGPSALAASLLALDGTAFRLAPAAHLLFETRAPPAL